jgi:predicted nucleotidyltransferase
LFVLRNYFDAGNAERTYAHAMDLLEAANFDVALAAVGMLGREVRDLAYPATHAALSEMLHTPKTYETLRQDLQARAAIQLGGFIDDSDALLAAFVKALF